MPCSSSNIIRMEEFTPLSIETKLNEVRCIFGTVHFVVVPLLSEVTSMVLKLRSLENKRTIARKPLDQ